MTEREHTPRIVPENYITKPLTDSPEWQTTGQSLADFLVSTPSPRLLLDVDGVLLQADSLDTPKLTSLLIIPALSSLESQGVEIGLATSRGEHALDFLRNEGLALTGPSILERGHLFLYKGERTSLAHPNHTGLIASFKENLNSLSGLEPSWEAVEAKADDNEFHFCKGDEQWQGENISYVWFHDRGEEYLQSLLDEVFAPHITELAAAHGMNYREDLLVTTERMQVGNLAMIGLRGKLHGQPVHKGSAMELFPQGPWAFAADGFGDMPLAVLTQQKGGKVIGIGGNLDIADEVANFMDAADEKSESPEEFAHALIYTSHLLKMQSMQKTL